MATSAQKADPVPSGKQKLPIGKIVVGLVVLAGIIVLFKVLPVGEWLKHFQAYVTKLGPLGYVVFTLVYALCTVLFISPTALTLGAGAIFGPVVGTILVVLGATLGAVVAFVLARTVMRKRVEGMAAANPKFRNVDKAISTEGAKIVFLVRLAPAFPFAFINYAFGLTGVKFLPYAIATFLGIIPGTTAFVIFGSAAAGAAAGGTNWVKLGIIIGITVIITVIITKVAANAIKKAGVEDDAPGSAEDKPESKPVTS